jgi:ribonuclease HI
MNDDVKLVIYADGGSRGNPGPAAAGVVIQDKNGSEIKKYGQFLGRQTNNEAEYQAVILALKKIKQIFGKKETQKMSLEIRIDSELVANQLNAEYKIEEERLFPFFIEIWNLKQDFGRIKFVLIPREKNRQADRLVNQALDQKQQDKMF